MFRTTQIFHMDRHAWSFLLTTYGVGALVGGIITPRLIQLFKPLCSLLTIFIVTRLLNIGWFIGLAWVENFVGAMDLLVMAGLHDVIGAICYFTFVQKNLLPKEESIFHTLSLPIFYGFVMLGTLLGELYTMQWVSLRQFWLIASGLALIHVLPFLGSIACGRRIR